jgi:hypothetical protein
MRLHSSVQFSPVQFGPTGVPVPRARGAPSRHASSCRSPAFALSSCLPHREPRTSAPARRYSGRAPGPTERAPSRRGEPRPGLQMPVRPSQDAASREHRDRNEGIRIRERPVLQLARTGIGRAPLQSLPSRQNWKRALAAAARLRLVRDRDHVRIVWTQKRPFIQCGEMHANSTAAS